ncbi:EAL domain-containing protein [Alcanivorax sp. S71-1-4]|uniref:EAL domain-containing protein n=1 Tax=Alcanivorax sp. S71-1-4 TaxID=1177159 RepID=UPI00135AA7B2|nr:EAL domain-containing protein [Alcanivorax sp. S71-1-4]KAF0809066.1 EAL domain-containing protein [Alcanivorax sp. S71-1-4]
MPLRELTDYFNRENLKRYGALRGDVAPLVSLGEAGVAGRFADITLGSAFQPVFHADSLRPAGFEALLRPVRQQQPLSPASVFLLPTDADEVVYLDRLCRTLHALNFLLQSRDDDGWLALNVHPRHLTGVLSEHGLVFESILQQCGLSPRRVVLEIGIAALLQVPHLPMAIQNYRRRGYRIAVDNVPVNQAPLPLLLKLQPDFIKLDYRSAPLPPHPALQHLLRELGDIGTGVVAVGMPCSASRALADLGVHYLQGDVLAPAAPQLIRTTDALAANNHAVGR